MPLAAVQLEDPLGDVVEEVAVVRDGDDRARVLLQVPLQPGDRLGVEVVGRLVEQQQVGLLQQHLAQGDAPPFAAGERRRPGVAGRQPHGVHGDLELAVEVPGVGGVDLRPARGPSRPETFSISSASSASAELVAELLAARAAGRGWGRRPPRRCRGRPCPRRGAAPAGRSRW